jgi:Uma2 family endonuclease
VEKSRARRSPRSATAPAADMQKRSLGTRKHGGQGSAFCLDTEISMEKFPAMTVASQLLEIPEVRDRVSPIAVEQYHQFPEFNENGRRTELIRGVVIEKMPKSPLHASIAKLLYDAIHAALPDGFSVRQDQPLTLHDSEPEPDIAVVRGSVQDYRTSHPATAVLVIEVAISSDTLDREKAALYAEAGVEEYWIVLPRERRVEVYHRPQAGAYLDRSISEGHAPLHCASIPSIRISPGDLF